MARWVVGVLLALVLATSVIAADVQARKRNTRETVDELQRVLNELDWDTLTEEEKQAARDYQEYVDLLYKELDAPEKKRDARANLDSIPGLVLGKYAPLLNLENQDRFRKRQSYSGNVEDLLVEYLSSKCGVIGFVCKLAIEPAVDKLLPDIAFVQSLNIDAGVEGTTATAGLDLLLQAVAVPSDSAAVAKILDIIGVDIYPTAVSAYLGFDAKFKTNFKLSEANLKGAAFANAQVFLKLIEFEDVNKNNAIDSGEKVGELSLSRAFKDVEITKVPLNGAFVYELASMSKDNVFGKVCVTADLPALSDDGQMITPNSTKCHLVIQNYPFKGKNSKLALETYVALAKAEFGAIATADATVTLNSQTQKKDSGYFAWNSTVSTETRQARVVASGTGTVKKDGAGANLLTDIVVLAGAKVAADGRRLTFVFDTTANPSLIVWDPVVGYGQVPKPKPKVVDTSSASVLAPLGALIAVATAFLNL